MQALDRIAFAEFSEVCHQQADAIVAAWREPFDQAAATLTVAHSHIGDVPLTDAQTILHKGANIAEVWAGARSAVETIDALLLAWASLMPFARLVTPQKGHELLRLAAIDWPTWRDTNLPDANPWAMVRASHTLSLPTADEYAQRVAVIEEGTRRAQLEAQRSREAGVFVR